MTIFYQVKEELEKTGNFTEEEIDKAINAYRDVFNFYYSIIHSLERVQYQFLESELNLCSPVETFSRIGPQKIAKYIEKDPSQDGAKNMILENFVEPTFENAFLLPTCLKVQADEIYEERNNKKFELKLKKLCNHISTIHGEKNGARFKMYIYAKLEKV